MKSSSGTREHTTLESPGALGLSIPGPGLPPQGTGAWSSKSPHRAPLRAERQSGCAGHVLILAGGPAIGCDATSGVSGESREGEQES